MQLPRKISPLDRRRRLSRRWLGLGLPALWLATVLLAFGLLWDRLPESMASHWGLSGRPDNALDKGVFFAALMVSGLGAALRAWGLTRPTSTARETIAPELTAVTFLGVAIALVAVTMVVLNLDVAEPWEARDLPPLVALAVIMTAAAGAGAAGGWARQLEQADHGPNEASTMEPSWVGTATNRPMMAAAAILAVATAWGALMLDRHQAWPVLLAATVMAVFGRATVRIDVDGLQVRLGVFGLPRIRIPSERLAHASAVYVEPKDHGGLGHRGNLFMQDWAAVVVRRGEGIQVALTDGKTFVVTVDDAERGARVLANVCSATSASRTVSSSALHA